MTVLVATLEYRVVWRWKSIDFPTREKERIYKTEKGARRRFEKLQANNGRFLFSRDDLFFDTYVLEYVRLETRLVDPWTQQEEWNAQ